MTNEEAVSKLFEFKDKVENGLLGYYDGDLIEALDIAITAL